MKRVARLDNHYINILNFSLYERELEQLIRTNFHCFAQNILKLEKLALIWMNQDG